MKKSSVERSIALLTSVLVAGASALPPMTNAQVAGVDWLLQDECRMLSDVPGFGKTRQTIEAAKKTGLERIGVVCLAKAQTNWQKEFNMWWPDGPTPEIRSFAKAASMPSGASRDLLIVDECHMIKGRKSQRTRDIYGHGCKAKTGLASQSERVWLLSATPAPHSSADYWTHLRALWPHYIGHRDFYKFLDYHFHYVNTEFGEKLLGFKHKEELRKVLATIKLKRNWEKGDDWLWHHVSVDAGAVAEKLLKAEAEHETVKRLQDKILDGATDFGDAHSHMATLRRAIGEIKAPVIAETIDDELQRGEMEKVILFAHHHSVINILHSTLAKYGVVQITGKTHQKDVDGIVEKFRFDPNTRVFIGQIQACGASLNIPCREVVFAEFSWTPDDNFQAAKRADRKLLQHLPVRVRVMGLARSIDDGIAAVNARKMKEQKELET